MAVTLAEVGAVASAPAAGWASDGLVGAGLFEVWQEARSSLSKFGYSPS